MSPDKTSAHTNPDRLHVPRWLFVTLAVANGFMVGTAASAFVRDSSRSSVAFVAGFGVAMLAMVGLPSVSLRFISRVALGTSAAVLLRLGVLSEGFASGGQSVLLWLLAAVTCLVLTELVAGATGPALGGEVGRASALQSGSTARRVALVSGAVIVCALLLSPVLLPLIRTSSEVGDGPTLDALDGDATALRSSDSMDMTTRPDLTDEVVFTVETDFATFWGAETYGQWDISASYDINENFTIFAEGINITEEELVQTGRFANQIYSVEDNGSRYAFGIRGSF